MWVLLSVLCRKLVSTSSDRNACSCGGSKLVHVDVVFAACPAAAAHALQQLLIMGVWLQHVTCATATLGM